MFKIDIRSSKPIYEQLTEQIKENIIKGYLKPGDIIPSVRKLAAHLGINPNTVSRAYQELERENIIITIRGKGTFIDEIKENQLNENKLNSIKEKIKPLIIEMKYLGMNNNEIIKEVKEICEKYDI